LTKKVRAHLKKKAPFRPKATAAVACTRSNARNRKHRKKFCKEMHKDCQDEFEQKCALSLQGKQEGKV
jgi:hypothetical protein